MTLGINDILYFISNLLNIWSVVSRLIYFKMYTFYSGKASPVLHLHSKSIIPIFLSKKASCKFKLELSSFLSISTTIGIMSNT